MDIAKEMTREALPIKCLEAVILGMYLYRSTLWKHFKTAVYKHLMVQIVYYTQDNVFDIFPLSTTTVEYIMNDKKTQW